MLNIKYSEKLLFILKNSKISFIPKRISPRQKYFRLYHKYYCEEFISESYFKVIETYNINNNDYVVISFADNIYWSISSEIQCESLYELMFDKDNILKQKIINSEKSYPGYQIIYWFYNHYNRKYSEFRPYIEDDGKCKVNENSNYFLYADYKNGKYVNVKFRLDKEDKRCIQ